MKPIADPPSSATKPLSLGVIFLTLYIDLIGFSVFFPLGPQLLRYYMEHESAGGLFAVLIGRLETIAQATHGSEMATAALFGGALGSIYSLMQFIFSPIWGARSDRTGRRPVLLLTIAGNALSFLILAFGGSFTVFLLSRIFSGIMGGNLAVAIAAVSDVTSRENRAKGMGIVGAAFGLGFLTGPAIGGLTAHVNLLTHHPSLEAWGVHPFSVPAFIGCGLCLINLAWVALRFRETLPAERRGAGATLRERNPLRAMLTLPDATLRRVNVVGFLWTLGFSVFETTISFFAADALSYDVRQTTMIFVHLGIVSILTQGLLVRRVIPKMGERRGALMGVLLIIAGFLGLGFGMGVAHSAMFMFIALTFCAIGSGFANVGLSSLVSLYAKPEEQGKVTGIYRSLGFLARACSPVLAGTLFFRAGGTVTFGVAGVFLLVPLFMA
ncbi:MAG TPA: MFS transporter, partial [Candidatus Didemnitutus sp.]|nr:MFS transporter [Candidatus Didemnitutus sp.]